MATSKKPVKKTVAKKTVKKTAAKAKPALDITPVKEKLTKTSLAAYIAEGTEVDVKDVKKVLADLEGIVLGSVHRKGVGEFMMSGLFKIVRQDVPAKKARKGTNPFTGEPTVFKAKPATVRVKIRPMAKLKNAVLA